MTEQDTNNKRRRLITMASLGGAAIATAGAVAPFAASFAPSRRTKGEGAPVQVDLASMEMDKLNIVPWRRMPVWVLFRTPELLASLEQTADELSDPNSEASVQPDSCKNATRSIKPEVFIAVGICTHLGCSPATNFPEGFLCACHGSHFDIAGRVVKGSPAPTNLPIPEHYYVDDDTIVIGLSEAA